MVEPREVVARSPRGAAAAALVLCAGAAIGSGCASTHPVPGAFVGRTAPGPGGDDSTVTITRDRNGPRGGWIFAFLRAPEPGPNARHFVCRPRRGFKFSSPSHADLLLANEAAHLVLDAKGYLERPRITLQVPFLLREGPGGWGPRLRWVTREELRAAPGTVTGPAASETSERWLILTNLGIGVPPWEEPAEAQAAPGSGEVEVAGQWGLEGIAVTVPRERFERLCEETRFGVALGFLGYGDALTVRAAPGLVVVESDDDGASPGTRLRAPSRRVELVAGRRYHFVYTLRWFGGRPELSEAPP